MMEQIEVTAAESVDRAIASIGRTEDVHLSPSNQRLAVAGFKKNSVLILSLRRSGGETIHIDSAITLKCSSFSYPHGVFWLSEDRLVVANREGEVAVVSVPDRPNTSELEVEALLVVGADETDLLMAPGSVFARRIGDQLMELLICNNSGHYVSRHVLFNDGRVLSAISAEIVATEGLSIPDGITCDRTHSFAAVSNHNDHSVHIYSMADFGPRARPRSILRGISYAHGLRFTNDGRYLLVADAGEPFVHIFHSQDGQWAEDLEPVGAIRVVDQEAFIRGRENEQEGGPKGIDITSDGKILCVSCHEQPLAFFELTKHIDKLAGPFAVVENAPLQPDTYLVERLAAARRELGELRRAAASPTSRARRARPSSQLDDLQQALDAMRESTSWKVTAPLRWVTSKLRRS